MTERVTRVSAYAVITSGRQILLVHQVAPGPAQDRWTLPGGGLGFGESPVDAVAREVREETGADVSVGPLLGVHDNVHDLGDGVLRHGVRLLFAGELLGTPAVPTSGEIDRVEWFALDDLPADTTEWARLGALFAQGERREDPPRDQH